MNFQEWFAAHRRRNPNAKINDRTRDLYRAWLRNNPQSGGPGDSPGGAGRVPGLTPATAQPAPSPASGPAPGQPAVAEQPPTTPAAPRIDAAREAELRNLANQRNLLPATYNIQRGTLANNLRSGLLDAGYFDSVGMTSQEGPSTARYMDFVTENNPQNPQAQQVRTLKEVSRPDGAPSYEGNVTYKFGFGPDGRLYRQAFVGSANRFAARGVFSSSLVGDEQRAQRMSLDTSRDRSVRNYNDSVAQVQRNQGTDDQRLTDAITTGNVGYQQWTGQQDATLAPAAPVGAAPQDVSGANNVVAPNLPAPPAGNLGSWTVKAAGSNAAPRLTRQVRSRNPGVSFRIVRQGNRYVAVRT